MTKRPEVHSKRTTVLAAIRPDSVALGNDWSMSTLSDILSAHPAQPHPRRRRRGLVIGVTVGAVLSGGAAYAGGLVPKFVTDAMDTVTSNDTGTWEDPAQIADLTLPDGRRFAVWRGDNPKGGQCEAVADGWDGRQRALSLGVGCWLESEHRTHATFTTASPGYPISQDGPDPDTVTPVLYGDNPEPDATRVVVTGPDVDVSLSIDATTNGFATVLPHGTSEFDRLVVKYVDADGQVLRTEHIQDF